ncbi:Hint domain-containing protein [Acetobacter estunensis]|nr:Hint domain-containing protein [Acetobacter estunensis]
MTDTTLSSGTTSSGITIASGDTLTVTAGASLVDATLAEGAVLSLGGTASNTSVGSNASMEVLSGGVTSGASVSVDGLIAVSAGGLMQGTVLTSAAPAHLNDYASAVISAGGSGSGTIILYDGGESVYGTETDDIIGGDPFATSCQSGSIVEADVQAVFSGGRSIHPTVNADGVILAEQGGTVISAVLCSSASLETSAGGVASNTVLESGAREIVYGSSIATTVHDGFQAIDSGGTATSAVIGSLGTQCIDSGGTASNTSVLSGGAVFVSAGGTLTSATLSGGTLTDEGAASSLTQTSGTTLVSGANATLQSATLQSGNLLSLTDHASATHVTLNSGNATVTDNAVLSSATIGAHGSAIITSAGTLLSGTVINGGQLSVLASGVASETTVNNGGAIQIAAGGQAYDTHLLTKSAIIGNGGSAFATYVDENSIISVTSGGFGSDLTLEDNANVNVYQGGKLSNVTVNNGWLALYAGGEADFVTINSCNLQSSVTYGSFKIQGLGAYVVGTVRNATINSGGLLTLMSSATAGSGVNITVNSGGLLRDYYNGHAIDAVLESGGTELISGLGYSTATTVNNGAVQSVTTGGISIAAQVQSGGLLSAAGKSAQAKNTTVVSGGTLTLSNGAVGINDTFSGGSAIVYNGGTLSGATLSAGDVTLSGGALTDGNFQSGTTLTLLNHANVTSLSATSAMVNAASGTTLGLTTVSAGSLQVSGTLSGGTLTSTTLSLASGATARSAILAGTTLNMASGASASGLALTDGTSVALTPGNVFISGIVEQGGTLAVASGATASALTVNDGILNISSGGTVTSALLDGGNTVISSGASLISGTVLDNGNLTIQSGAIMSALTLSGGYANLESGAELSGAALSGGNTTLQSGALLISATLENTGIVTVQSTASASDVNITGGRLLVESGGQTDHASVAANGTLYVSGGGATSTLVSGGSLSIDADGSAANTTVVDGGQLTVGDPSTSTDTIVSSGGTLVVDSSGVASNTTVLTDGTLIVSSGSLANTTTLTGGSAFITGSGAQLQTATLSDNATLTVTDHATATNVTVESGLIDVTSTGSLDAANVDSGGTISATNGAILSGITVNGGKLEVDSGSLVSTLVAQEGAAVHMVGGTVVSATISNAGLEVTSGSVASDISVLASGVFVVGSNSISTDALISSGGTASLSGGTGSRTQLFSSGREIVSSDGREISGVVNNGGTLEVLDGGTAQQIIVSSGGQVDVEGGMLESATLSSGSTQNVSLGATAGASTVKNGAAENILSGAVESGGTIESGGSLSLASGGSGTDINLLSGGVISVIDGARLSDVTFASGGTIDLDSEYWSAQDNDRPTFIVDSAGSATLSATENGHDYLFTLIGDYTGLTVERQKDADGTVELVMTGDGAACYCRGTLIRTPEGERPVESLRIGDRVVTYQGEHRAILWIGRRNHPADLVANNLMIAPVTFRAGSLGNDLPLRDLKVSPLHSMYVENVLIPASALVNGQTILQSGIGEDIEYFHIELETHDIIFAENAPSETFLDTQSRSMFHNAEEFYRLYPNLSRPPAQFCAPRIEHGPELECIRQNLVRQASCPPTLHPGHVDEHANGFIRGWARTDQPDATQATLVLMEHNVPIALFHAKLPRPDVIAAGIHGFGFEENISHLLDPHLSHELELRLASDRTLLAGCPLVIEATASAQPQQPTSPLQGHVDMANHTHLKGWACNDELNPASVELEISVNNHPVIRTLANVLRPDLQRQRIGSGWHGFDLRFPSPLVASQQHIVRICRVSDGTELPGSPVILEPIAHFEQEISSLLGQARKTLAYRQDRARLMNILDEQMRLLVVRDTEDNRQSFKERDQQARRAGTPVPLPHRSLLLLVEQLSEILSERNGILQHLLTIQDLGFRITVATINRTDDDNRILQYLSENDLSIDLPFRIFGIENFLRQHGKDFEVVLTKGMDMAVRYVPLIRSGLPSIRILILSDGLSPAHDCRKKHVAEISTVFLADGVVTSSKAESQFLQQAVPGTPVFDIPLIQASTAQPKRGFDRRAGLLVIDEACSPLSLSSSLSALTVDYPDIKISSDVMEVPYPRAVIAAQTSDILPFLAAGVPVLFTHNREQNTPSYIPVLSEILPSESLTILKNILTKRNTYYRAARLTRDWHDAIHEKLQKKWKNALSMCPETPSSSEEENTTSNSHNNFSQTPLLT